MRATPRFAQLTVRDIYLHRRLGAIAGILDRMGDTSRTQRTGMVPSGCLAALALRLAQAVCGAGLVAIRMAQWLAPFFTYHFFTGDRATPSPMR